MSFVKIPRKYAGRPQYGHNTKRRKHPPQWDDTINDLSVHKATREELDRRKEVTTSKNMDLVKADVMKKKLHRSVHRSGGRTPGRKRKTALMKEVLYDTSQLHDVLATSDRMMSVVRDLFGDDPMKYKGLPHVTTAPNKGYTDNSLPDGSILEEPSKLDMLSDSIMDKSALNEFEHDYEDELSDSDYEDVPSSYKPQLDLGRFQQLLTRAEAELEKDRAQHTRSRGDSVRTGSSSMTKELAAMLAKKQDFQNGRITPTTAVELTSPTTGPTPGAINDTIKVRKTKSRLTEQEKSSISRNETTEGPSFNLDHLRQVLSGLENNVSEYERMTGRQRSAREEEGDNNTLTGFTGRLVNAVNKVSRYLKENELRLKAESTLREQLHSDVVYLKTLVDTLTSDIIATQEQYVSLQGEFVKYRKETSDQFTAIRQGLESRGIQIHPIVLPVAQNPGNVSTASQNIGTYPPVEEQYQFSGQNQPFVRENQPGLNPQQRHSSSANDTPANIYQQYNNNVDNDLARQVNDQLRMTSINNTSGLSALPLGVPRQTDSPKAIGKSRSRVQDQMSVSQNISQNGNEQPRMSHTYSGLPQPYSNGGMITNSNINATYPNMQGNSYVGAFQPVTNRAQMTGVYNTVLPSNNPLENSNNSAFRGMQANQMQNAVQPNQINMSLQPHSVLKNNGQDFPRNSQIGLMRNSGIEPMRNSGFQPMNNAGSEPMRNSAADPNNQSNGTEPRQVMPSEMSINLEKQIQELNKQHAQAQNKLQELMFQQEVVENNMSVKNHQPVSPPISPITVASDVDSQHSSARSFPNNSGFHQHKAIKVSLPRVENIIELQSQGE